jgi:cytochrome P450
MRRSLEPALGQAILTAEGARWRLQRRVAAPVFRPANVNSFLPAMIHAARDLRDAWAAHPDGTQLEITSEMMHVTFDIILETMLSGRGDTDVARVERSISDFLESTGWAVALSALHAPGWMPYPGKAQADRGSNHLRSLVSQRIAERRRTGERRDDLLSLMLDAKDPETGEGLADEDIRDNIITFIGAGHETTALALSWTFYLLHRNPDIERRVLDEIARVTGGADLAPVGMVVRQSTRPLTIGGVEVSPHDHVFIPIYAIHHHADLWPNPEIFDPDRFQPEAIKQRHRWSYLPFGAGPRICIGMGFALLEAVAILGTLLPYAKLTAEPDFIPTPKLRITMRPAEGMPMRLERRLAKVETS